MRERLAKKYLSLHIFQISGYDGEVSYGSSKSLSLERVFCGGFKAHSRSRERGEGEHQALPIKVCCCLRPSFSHFAKDAGIIAAVNQQLRFEEGVAAAHKMVELGWIGTVSNFSINVNLITPWEMWPWAKDLERLEVMLHSIHYHDLIRWFLGDAKTVFCAAGRTAGQFPKGETRTISTALYKNGVTSLVHANHVNRGGDNYAEYRIDGDKGSIRGTLGLLYDYPNGRVDTLEVNSQVLPTDGWLPYPVTTRWFPDAFIGTMGSVMDAVSSGLPLRASVADNIGTLKMVAALYKSMDSGVSVDL